MFVLSVENHFDTNFLLSNSDTPNWQTRDIPYFLKCKAKSRSNLFGRGGNNYKYLLPRAAPILLDILAGPRRGHDSFEIHAPTTLPNQFLNAGCVEFWVV